MVSFAIILVDLALSFIFKNKVMPSHSVRILFSDMAFTFTQVDKKLIRADLALCLNVKRQVTACSKSKKILLFLLFSLF